MKWEKRTAVYAAYGRLTAGIVGYELAIDGWVAKAIIRGTEVHRSEHMSRDAAIRAADRAVRRGCALRRFEQNPPSPERE
jgi:hypothetical protein